MITACAVKIHSVEMVYAKPTKAKPVPIAKQIAVVPMVLLVSQVFVALPFVGMVFAAQISTRIAILVLKTVGAKLVLHAVRGFVLRQVVEMVYVNPIVRKIAGHVLQIVRVNVALCVMKSRHAHSRWPYVVMESATVSSVKIA